MAELREKAPIGLNMTAILHPLLQHRFMLEFESRNLSRDERNALTAQVVDVRTDFMKKEVYVNIQQPLFMSAVAEAVEQLASDRYDTSKLVLHFLDGCESSVCRLEFSHSRCKSHSFEVNYAETGIATHKMTFGYSNMNAVHETKKLG